MFFEKTTLTTLGLIIQLGHRPGDICPNASQFQDLMVFDLNGVCCLVVRYCLCADGVPKHTQLLRACWFPATIHRPSTAFSFNMLDFFHKLQDRNKCNPYDFYHTIIQRTDAAGLDPEIVNAIILIAIPHQRIAISIDTTKSLWYSVYGVISNSSNVGVLFTLPTTFPPYPMGALQSPVLPARIPERILPIFPNRTCTNDFPCRVVCTHLVVKLEEYIVSWHRCVL